MCRGADGFVFSSTENNFSFSAPLKNALDWGSRFYGGNETNVFNKKWCFIMGAGGGSGSLRSNLHLRDVSLALNLNCLNSDLIV